MWEKNTNPSSHLILLSQIGRMDRIRTCFTCFAFIGSHDSNRSGQRPTSTMPSSSVFTRTPPTCKGFRPDPICFYFLEPHGLSKSIIIPPNVSAACMANFKARIVQDSQIRRSLALGLLQKRMTFTSLHSLAPQISQPKCPQ